MDCTKCKSSNPEGKKYCGECGSPLDAQLGPVQAYLETHLRPQVATIIDERLKDQKIVETEVTEAVATKLLNWAKLFVTVVGVPLTILALVLGFLGVKSYSDLRAIVNKTKNEVTATFEKENKRHSCLSTQLIRKVNLSEKRRLNWRRRERT